MKRMADLCNTPISISSLITYNSEVTVCSDITADSTIIFDKLLYENFEYVFRAKCGLKTVIVKVFHGRPFGSTEFEILQYLQEESATPEMFPQPYMKILNPVPNSLLPTLCNIRIKNVWQILIYEYIEGKCIQGRSWNNTENLVLHNSISRQLYELHSLALVHNDVAARNIIKDPEGNYYLIDYGNAYSLSDHRFQLNNPFLYGEKGDDPYRKDMLNLAHITGIDDKFI